MKTSTEIGSIEALVGQEKAVELVAKAGFDAFDFSLFPLGNKDAIHPLNSAGAYAHARKLKQIAMDNGIVCNQSHAPFPVRDPYIYSKLKASIELTAEAGGNICIIHPDNHKNAEQNAEMYNELLPFAKQCGVKIATENMFNTNKETGRADFAACATAEDFNAHLDAVNDDFLVACLDLGHAEIMGEGTSAPQMIYALGSRLKALHIHDNDHIRDRHQIPFSMQMDFEAIAKALKDINYDGYLTLEAIYFLKDFTSENALDGVKKLFESVDKFRNMII
jgi:sugar phosphate isomerase/epimerase